MSFRHRDSLYKRSQNGPHIGLAARLAAPTSLASGPGNNGNGQPPSDPLTHSPDPKTSAVFSPFTPLDPIVLTTQTPTTPTTPSSDPSTPTVDTSTPSASSPSSASASASAAASASSPTPSASSAIRTSSESTRATPSAVSTPLSAALSTSAYVPPSIATQVVSGHSSISMSSASPTASSAGSGSSGGTNTGAIVGGIAGTLAGIAVLGFLLMWCMRRQRNKDMDDFDAQAFRRQSAVLVDDPVESSQSYNPRPPTMIERHNASPALAAQAGIGGQNFYGSYGGYGQQSPYPSPEMLQPIGSPSPQGFGAPSMGYPGYNDPQQSILRHPSNGGYPAYDSQQQLARQPSNATYLSRQPTVSFDPNVQYTDLNRSSVSPYQAAQYADISRHLGTADPNTHAPQQHLELPDDPLPSPFDDPVEAIPASPHNPTSAAVSGLVTTAPTVQTKGNATQHHERRATVYEEGDAYGGI